jgi:hypothetical protein
MFEYFTVGNNRMEEDMDMQMEDNSMDMENPMMVSSEDDGMMMTEPPSLEADDMTCEEALMKAQEVCINKGKNNKAINNIMMNNMKATKDAELSAGMDEEPIIEGFQASEDNTNTNTNNSELVKKLMYTLLFMCLYYLLSHKETYKWVMANVKGLNATNAHLLMTLVFGICFLLLKRYL